MFGLRNFDTHLFLLLSVGSCYCWFPIIPIILVRQPQGQLRCIHPSCNCSSSLTHSSSSGFLDALCANCTWQCLGYLLSLQTKQNYCTLKYRNQSSINSHAYKFQTPFSSKNALKFSFFPRTSKEWNQLPAEVGFVSIARCVQVERDYFYEQQSKLHKLIMCIVCSIFFLTVSVTPYLYLY